MMTRGDRDEIMMLLCDLRTAIKDHRPDHETLVRALREAVREVIDDLRAQHALRPRFASLGDAATKYGIGRRQLRAHIRAGRLHGYAPGEGKLLIEINELEQFIRTHRVAAGDADIEKLADDAIAELQGAKG